MPADQLLQQPSCGCLSQEVPPDKLFTAMLPVDNMEKEREELAVPAMKVVSPASSAQKHKQLSPTQTSLPQKPKAVDYSMIKVGSALYHKAFGDGTVTELGGGYIKVTFSDVEKKFVFPNAILQGFLSIPEN